jgi:hypothetical protein
MTAKQYRTALEALGLTAYGAAPWLGVALRTSQNYASGQTAVPEPVARLLRLVIALKLTPDKTAELWG